MGEIRYLKCFIIYFIVAAFGGFAAGGIMGFFLGFILGILGVPVETIGTICGILGFVLGVFISYYVFRWAVGKYIVPQCSSNSNMSETEEITV